jgi:hypothetical protein
MNNLAYDYDAGRYDVFVSTGNDNNFTKQRLSLYNLNSTTTLLQESLEFSNDAENKLVCAYMFEESKYPSFITPETSLGLGSWCDGLKGQNALEDAFELFDSKSNILKYLNKYYDSSRKIVSIPIFSIKIIHETGAILLEQIDVISTDT